MKDESKTKKQLIEELKRIRQQADEFERSAFPIRNRRKDLLRHPPPREGLASSAFGSGWRLSMEACR